MPRIVRRVVLAAIAATALLLPALAGAQGALAPELPSGWTPKTAVRAEQEIVVAAHPLAARAGASILAAGGTAVDAAIAVQMVLNLVEPQSSGIGGGAFLVHWSRWRGALDTYDGRETAPAGASEGLFLDASGRPLAFRAAQIGGRSVGTPGLLRMLELAHREHGRLAWARLFEPAIALAEQGFPLSPRLHAALAGADAALRNDPAAGALFYRADGTPKPVGTIVRNPALAATLRAVAAGGADAFHHGPIAADIVAAVRAHPTNPGALSLADLAGYRAVRRDPVCGTYRGRRICGVGMPSSGTVTALMTLAMLEGFDLRAMAPGSVDAVHLIAEAYRLAYADRAAYMADADFVRVPLSGLLDRDYLAERARSIDPRRSMGAPSAGRPPGCCGGVAWPRGVQHEAAGTSHVSIVDVSGNAVSMTTTIENAFGSHVMVRGFLLNNQLTDFSFAPTDAGGAPVANRVEPGKRPRSSMAPLLVFDGRGRLEAVIGSPGGSAIIQYAVKTLVGLYDWKLGAQQAIDLGNFGAQTSAATQLERGSELPGLAGALQARGHTVSVVDLTSGLHVVVANAIRDADARGPWAWLFPTPGWTGAADPRREGLAIGR